MPRTDSEGIDPSRYTPCSDPELPLPADLRSDSELPSCAKSITAIAPAPTGTALRQRAAEIQKQSSSESSGSEPRHPRQRPSARWERRSDSGLPSATESGTDSENIDPTRASPFTDAELPTGARRVLGLRSDSELPRYTKAKYGQRAPESTEAAKRQRASEIHEIQQRKRRHVARPAHRRHGAAGRPGAAQR